MFIIKDLAMSYEISSMSYNKGKAGVQKSALAGKLAINNGTTNKYIDRSELDDYLASG